VAVPYPSEGLWSIAFLTGSSFKSLREATGEELVTVFVPSSPMPMTGWTIHVRASRVVPLPISVDDAFAATVSGGVLVPPGQYAGPLPARLLSEIPPKSKLQGETDVTGETGEPSDSDGTAATGGTEGRGPGDPGGPGEEGGDAAGRPAA
jgi:hypothetical protein